MKITVKHIVLIIVTLLLLYGSIMCTIIPLIKNEDIIFNSVSGVLGLYCTLILTGIIIMYLCNILSKNWNKGFNINLKFNKNKQ